MFDCNSSQQYTSSNDPSPDKQQVIGTNQTASWNFIMAEFLPVEANGITDSLAFEHEIIHISGVIPQFASA